MALPRLHTAIAALPGSFLACILCISAWAPMCLASTSAPPSPTPPSDVVVMLQLDGDPLAENVVATEQGGTLYLPICSIADLLSLSLTCTDRQAYGFVVRETRPFVIDLEEGVVISERNVVKIGESSAFMQGTDMMVDIAALSRWLPVDFHYQQETSTVAVHPREVLPLQAFRKRQKQYQRSVAAPKVVRNFADFTPQRRLLSIPTIDLTAQGGLAGTTHGTLSGDIATTLDASADILYLSGIAHLWLEKESVRRLSLSLLRRSEVPFRIGPLPVTQLVLGGVPLPSVDGIGGGTAALSGILLSNRPLAAPSNFLSHDIVGNLPEGWDAELIHNGVPLSYQPPSNAGSYRFDNLRLHYGLNTFKVILNGPFGEHREYTQTFVSDAVTPTGAFLYTVAAGLNAGLSKDSGFNDDPDSEIAMTADFGLFKDWTGSALLVREVEADGNQRNYAGFGMRTALGYNLLSLELIHSFSPRGRTGQLFTARTISRDILGIALQAEQRLFRDFESQRFPRLKDPLVSQTALRGTASVAALGEFRLPVAGEVILGVRRSGQVEGISNWHVSGGWNGWNGAIETNVSYANESVSAGQTLQITTRLDRTSIRGTAGFTLLPNASTSAINLSADRDLEDGYQLQAGVLHDPRSGIAEFRAGITRRRGPVGYLLSATGATNGAYSVRAGVSTSVAVDTYNNQTAFSAAPLAPFGMIAVSAATGAPGDMDRKEVTGVGFLVNGSRAITVTGSSGSRVIAFLEPDIPVDVTVDLTTLEDPFMVPQEEGCHITPRAGVVSACRFTMVTGGEIDGMVFADLKGSDQVPLKGVTVNLLKMTGADVHLVASTISQDSGYYLFKAVRPGRYQIAVPEAELKRLGTAAVAPLLVEMPEGGDQVTGKDFVLEVAKDAPGRKMMP